MSSASVLWAPLGRRLGAVGLDYLVVSSYIVALVLIGVAVRSAGLSDELFGSPLTGELVGFLVLTLPVTLYFALTEASARKATLGKRWVGLRVTSVDGERLSLGRSVLRSATKFVPWELAHAAIWRYTVGSDDVLVPNVLLAASWLFVAVTVTMAILDGRHRALHDRVAGSLVVRAVSP